MLIPERVPLPQSTSVGRRLPPESYFVGSAVFHYLGPAFAVLLFARVEPLGVAWLRIVSAALVFALWRRPWRIVARLDASGLRLLLAMGAVLAVMNVCFYVAIDRLPLGTVAAIEFLPVIALAAVGTRGVRNLFALALAAAGVYLLTDVRLEGEPLGVAVAFANAGLFALYIVLAHRLAHRRSLGGIDGLGAAMLVAAAVVTPIAAWEAVPALDDPVVLAAGVGVGISSSVIPYVFDQLAMARMRRETYALLVSLLPATATVIGIVVLGQLPTRPETAGLALVIAGVAIHRVRPATVSETNGTGASGGGVTCACRGRNESPRRRRAAGKGLRDERRGR
ncbi:MAG: EamA family transporter [Actinomycetota bacterium]|nr:EamA family transporter [Actinomycetota bacterium]